jgi:glutamyl-Q tRNA(Asp) synthetase
LVLNRAAGLSAYPLGVVTHAAAHGDSDVVGGADLLDSTARQIYLQRLLGLPTPRYLHVPVALDAAGAKLSKQAAAAPIEADPRALRRALAYLGQPDAATLDEALRAWEPQLISRRRAMALAP